MCKSSSMQASSHRLHDPALDLLSKGPVKAYFRGFREVCLSKCRMCPPPRTPCPQTTLGGRPVLWRGWSWTISCWRYTFRNCRRKLQSCFCIPSMVSATSALIWGRSTATESSVGIYVFQPDTTTSRPSHQPLIKATMQPTVSINSLCDTPRASLFHKENYAQVILTVVVEFYQRCSARFQELILTGEQILTDADLKVALAADWAQRPDLHPWLFEIFKIDQHPEEGSAVSTRNTSLLAKTASCERNNLIASTRSLATLGSLYKFGEWMSNLVARGCMNLICIAALDALKAVPEIPLSPTTPLKLTPMLPVIPYTAGVPFLRPFDPSPIATIEGNSDVSRGAPPLR